MTLPAAGWYTDPGDDKLLRFWDGTTWSSATRHLRAGALILSLRWGLVALALVNAVVAIDCWRVATGPSIGDIFRTQQASLGLSPSLDRPAWFLASDDVALARLGWLATLVLVLFALVVASKQPLRAQMLPSKAGSAAVAIALAAGVSANFWTTASWAYLFDAETLVASFSRSQTMIGASLYSVSSAAAAFASVIALVAVRTRSKG